MVPGSQQGQTVPRLRIQIPTPYCPVCVQGVPAYRVTSTQPKCEQWACAQQTGKHSSTHQTITVITSSSNPRRMERGSVKWPATCHMMRQPSARLFVAAMSSLSTHARASSQAGAVHPDHGSGSVARTHGHTLLVQARSTAAAWCAAATAWARSNIKSPIHIPASARVPDT